MPFVSRGVPEHRGKKRRGESENKSEREIQHTPELESDTCQRDWRNSYRNKN